MFVFSRGRAALMSITYNKETSFHHAKITNKNILITEITRKVVNFLNSTMLIFPWKERREAVDETIEEI